MPESYEHRRIKELMTEKLREWFSVSIEEYPDSGHELDVYAVTPDRVSIYVEVIWSDSRTNFYRDLSMIQSSNAKVKLVIASPKVLGEEEYIRAFRKVVISERNRGTAIHPEFLDGQRILEDNEYLDTEVKKIISDLIKSRGRTRSIDGFEMKNFEEKRKLMAESLPSLASKAFAKQKIERALGMSEKKAAIAVRDYITSATSLENLRVRIETLLNCYSVSEIKKIEKWLKSLLKEGNFLLVFEEYNMCVDYNNLKDNSF